MKKIISISLSFALIMSVMAFPTFATGSNNAQVSQNLTTMATQMEIQEELTAAENVLGAPCKLESVEKTLVGNYIVESRLYVVNSPDSTARSGEVGGLSSHVWYSIFDSSEWDVKVLLSAFFYYNGSTAICIPEKIEVWAVNYDREEIGGLDTNITPTDGDPAKVACVYNLFDGSEPSGIGVSILNPLTVKCSKDGVVTIENEDKTYF